MNGLIARLRRTRLHITLMILAIVGSIGVPVSLAYAAAPAFEAPFRCGYRQGAGTSSPAHQTPWELDFWTKVGVPVTAVADGRVRTASMQYTNGYGKLIVIEHSGGYTSYYAHLSKITVKVGQKVSRGDLIGASGATSAKYKNMGPHLHFEIRKGNAYPGGIQPVVFHGKKFPYPRGYITSHNCPTTKKPTKKATSKPTGKPTVQPTQKPTQKGSAKPTGKATPQKPTGKPEKPTATPTKDPKDSKKPTVAPTETAEPTKEPTTAPTRTPASPQAETPQPQPQDPQATDPELDGPDLSETNPKREEQGPAADTPNTTEDADPVVDQQSGRTQSGGTAPDAPSTPATQPARPAAHREDLDAKDRSGGLAKTGR